ncbi:hypothetical protein Lal_00005917 [Lupinus albus]|nr:hypothetical protein Lal_00005917 [Lupinus albus]
MKLFVPISHSYMRCEQSRITLFWNNFVNRCVKLYNTKEQKIHLNDKVCFKSGLFKVWDT